MSTTQQPQPMMIPSLAGALAKKQNRKPAASRPAPCEAVEPLSAQKAPGGGEEAALDRETPQAEWKISPEPEVANPTSGAGRTKAAAPTRVYSQPMSLYLPRSVHQALLNEANTRKSTNTALILQAINATHLKVGEALPAVSGPAPTDLFEIPQRRTEAEPTVQTTIRVTDAQLEAIDGLASAHSSNRSQIVAAAVRLYFDED